MRENKKVFFIGQTKHNEKKQFSPGETTQKQKENERKLIFSCFSRSTFQHFMLSPLFLCLGKIKNKKGSLLGGMEGGIREKTKLRTNIKVT